ncbi:hypothetical protein AB3S75_011267 [Citrus x aurantiifolia]
MNKHADFEEHFYLETALTPTLLIIWLLQLDTHTLGLGPSPSLGLYLLSSFWVVALVYPYFWGSDPIDYKLPILTQWQQWTVCGPSLLHTKTLGLLFDGLFPIEITMDMSLG